MAGLRLDQAIARAFPQYSRNRLQAWLRDGHIKIDGSALDKGRGAAPGIPLDRSAARSRTINSAVLGGERVEIVPPRAASGRPPEAQRIPLSIIYEDADLLVINKAAGMVVHPGAGVPDGTLMNALLAHARELAEVPRAGIVHRLDKDTSGLLVVARNVTAQAELVKQLADRSMRRTYLAIVHGDPPGAGKIDAAIARDTAVRTRMAVSRRGKEARTAFRVMERFGQAALVECRLETGRTHQIRVHMQHIRHPLVGDPVYRRGTRYGIDFPRQALHAVELTLKHPRSGKSMTWQSAPPQDFKSLLQRLRRGH